MTSTLSLEWIEDFRLYLISFWPDIYAMSADLTSSDKWLEVLRTLYLKISIAIWRQPFYVQILLFLIFIVTILLIILRIWVVLTTGVCKSKARMDGKTAIITGANSGIGLETARDLSSRGARVILACRNLDRGRQAAEEISSQSKEKRPELVVRKLDLTCSRSVREFCRGILDTERRLDVLVLNAGLALNQKYQTEDGMELHMAANHLGHFLLANLLAPLMVRTAKTSQDGKWGRVVVVSSIAHHFANLDLENLNSEKYYDASYIYGTTKLANVLFARELSRRLRGHRVSANALHPGAVRTGIFRNLAVVGHVFQFAIGLLFKTAKEGAQTSIYLSVSEEVEGVTGEYFSDCAKAKSSKQSQDMELALKLWDKSVDVLQMEPSEEVPAPN